MTLAIVNDYEIVVRGLADMLRTYPERIEVVELNADTGVVNDVDVALYDTFAQQQGDQSSVRDLAQNPNVGRVVIYPWNFDQALARRTLDHGVAGYLAKSLPASALVDALERVHLGESVVSPDPGRTQTTMGDWPGREEGLTARESEVLALITQGMSNQDIARQTMLSINSIKSYIRSAYRKIGVVNRSNAILWGVEHGFRPDRLRVLEPQDRLQA